MAALGVRRLKGVAFQNKCEQRYHEAGEQVANGLRNFQHESSWLELGSLIPRQPASNFLAVGRVRVLEH